MLAERTTCKDETVCTCEVGESHKQHYDLQHSVQLADKIWNEAISQGI